MFEGDAIDWCSDEGEGRCVQMFNDLDVLEPAFNRVNEILKGGNLHDKGVIAGCGGVQ